MPALPPHREHRRRRRQRCGFTLIEATISVVIVAVVMLAAVRAAGAAARAQHKSTQRFKAQFLASGLIAQVMQAAYEEPRGGTVLGRDAGELATSKTNYNDVDDYHGWMESPPQDRTGAAMAAFNGWTRTVTVERVNPDNLVQTSASDTGAKRVTVTVRYDGVPLATHVGVRTRAP